MAPKNKSDPIIGCPFGIHLQSRSTLRSLTRLNLFDFKAVEFKCNCRTKKVSRNLSINICGRVIIPDHMSMVLKVKQKMFKI